MFKASFYYLIERGQSTDAIAVITMLEDYYETGKRSMKRARKNASCWYEIQCAKPCVDIKMFLALLGNKELCNKILGF